MNVSHAAQKLLLKRSQWALTFMCLHSIPDPASNDVIVFQVPSTEIRLATPDQRLRQLRLLRVQYDSITFCGVWSVSHLAQSHASRSAPRNIEKSVSMDRVRTVVDGVPVEDNPRARRKECSRRAIADCRRLKVSRMSRMGKCAIHCGALRDPHVNPSPAPLAIISSLFTGFLDRFIF